MKAVVSQKFARKAGARRLRGTFDFAAIADRARMPWRFLARRMAVDGLSAG
jgi:hypothetical protein